MSAVRHDAPPTDAPPTAPPRPSATAFAGDVVRIEQLSPTFRRITLGGEGMSGFGIPHHPRDQRIKLIIPPSGEEPPLDLAGIIGARQRAGLSWYQAWLELEEHRRGVMRTYTVREWRDGARELVVDMVLHTDAQGRSGPAAQWAAEARIGSLLHLIGPSRHGEPTTAGIDFHPGGARTILLAGDETAVPAIASILDHLQDSGVTAHALLEVPCAEDILPLALADGLHVTWLPRDGAPIGARLDPEVRELLRRDEVLLAAARAEGDAGTSRDTLFYAWLAGEAGVVTQLRRHLVRDLGIDRDRVAFTGYWKRGRAEGA